ncbi:hypothetical protein B8A44_05260 [Dolosigranulum pigrum]|uniref:Uncharacterized protein n=1 Tax=Dolosigranulum pigrum TaxID=29394 RepID=A0A328KVB7_9LACT|nr:hypothetical protein B8A44_05260 [Dolosigranulum pigrum]
MTQLHKSFLSPIGSHGYLCYNKVKDYLGGTTMNRFFNNKFARLIGIFIVVMMIIAMVEDIVEDTVKGFGYYHPLYSADIIKTMGVIIVILVGMIIAGTIYIYRRKNSPKTAEKMPPLTTEKQAFYQAKGLTKEDMAFFRHTMQTTKETIQHIDTTMEKASKLQAIEKRNRTITTLKAFFQDITTQPERLHEVDQFLYVHLPALDDLTQKYIKVDAHKPKSKATLDILHKSAETIDMICQKINDEYETFHQGNVNHLTTTIELTEDSLDNPSNLF